MPTLVTGQVELPQSADSFSGATLFVSLESIGMMDMPSEIIAETVQRDIHYDGDALSFLLEGDVGDSSGPFNVRVHISMDGSGDVKKGDYLTKRHYAVLENNNPDYVVVTVERV